MSYLLTTVLERRLVNAHTNVNPKSRVWLFRGASVVTLAAALAVVGCQKEGGSAATAPKDAGAAKPAEVTVLITADEQGWIAPGKDAEDKEVGGAAQLLGKWVKDEGHCVPPAGQAGADACKDSRTLALTTGDHFNGPAISSFFFGEPTADVMGRMGYAASGLGNHELDFGIDQFVKNRARGGFPYLAANVSKEAGDERLAGLEVKPFEVFERQGVKIAVIGLANVDAPKTVMAGRFHGINVAGYEQTLTEVLPKVASADAVVVLVDECPSALESLFEAHKDWKIDLVAGGHCRQPYDKKIGDTQLFSPGRRFEKYVRAKFTVDPSKPAGERTEVDAKVVEVGNAEPHAELATVVDAWKKRLEESLGEEIGFTKTGLKQDSPEMAKWIATAFKDTLETDVALINKGGVRQDLPPGKITKASVYSVLPFENSLMVVKLPGEALIKALGNDVARYAGVTKSGSSFKDAKGKAIDPKGTYTVATVEYLYFGGDGFELEQHDPLPTETGMVWQTALIDWTKKQATSEKKPLEKALPRK